MARLAARCRRARYGSRLTGLGYLWAWRFGQGQATPRAPPRRPPKRHNVQYKTANDAFKRLEHLAILREITGAGYGRIYVWPRVAEIVSRP